MGRSVRELLETVDSRELAEWMAFSRIDPFDERRADLRAGIIASTVANVNRGKNGKALKPIDFMPYSLREKKEADKRTLGARIRALFSTMEER